MDGVCLNWPGQHINRTARRYTGGVLEAILAMTVAGTMDLDFLACDRFSECLRFARFA